MDEKKEAWFKKYRPDIPADGFIAEYCTPEHIRGIVGENGVQYYIGFDGERKTYTQLTEEEKQDLIEQGKEQDISKVLGILKDIQRITDKEER